MPYHDSSRNKKIEDIFLPLKKNRTNVTTKTSADDRKMATDQFITPKRRRRLPLTKKEEMNKLLDKIGDAPFYENDLPTFNNEDESSTTAPDLDNNPAVASVDQQMEWLYNGDAHSGTASPTADDLAKMADAFLEEELTEQLKQALSSTELQDDDVINYQYFGEYCKLPNPLLKIEHMELADKSTRIKYEHIIKYSQPEDARHFLLSSGQLTLWYRLGWQCPRSVLQWLIEVVAFDKNIETAKFAMSTISSLWFDVLEKKTPSRPVITDDMDYDQHFSVDMFSYILASYGALNKPTIASDQKYCDRMVETEGSSNDRIPLTQLGWVLDLLKTSLTLWPTTYTISQLHSLANTLICLGMDGIGMLALKHIQDTLDACLCAIPGDDFDWKTQVQQLALALCEQQFTSVGLQVRLPSVAKPTYDRCLYLQRVLAVVALELALEKDQQQITTITFGTANAVTQSPMASSQGKMQSLSLLLASDGDAILRRLADMTKDPRSIFRQTDPSYQDYSDRICLLDYAIGNSYTEFMNNIDAIHSLVTQLQASSRKIGGGLGTLERTKANEVTQRLWSRLAYVIGRNGNTVEEIDF